MKNTAMDKERTDKASQTAILLVDELRDLVKADNPLLSEVAIDLLQQAVELENKIKRINSAVNAEDAKKEAGNQPHGTSQSNF